MSTAKDNESPYDGPETQQLCECAHMRTMHYVDAHCRHDVCPCLEFVYKRDLTEEELR